MDVKTKFEIDLLLEEILATPVDAKLADVFVVMSGIAYQKTSAPPISVESLTALYHIGADENGKNTICDTIIVDDSCIEGLNGTINPELQRPDLLARIFRAIPSGESDDIFLVTWDHGAGFGIFRDENPDRPVYSPQQTINEQLDRFPSLKRFWDQVAIERWFVSRKGHSRMQPDFYRFQGNGGLYSIARSNSNSTELNKNKVLTQEAFNSLKENPNEITEPGETTDIPEILRNDELSWAIKNGFPKRKIAVLLMMNCNQMNLHAMNSFQGVVDIFVAPESLIDYPAYNYRDILAQFSKDRPDKEITADAVGIACITTIQSDRALQREKKALAKFSLGNSYTGIFTWKVFAVDLNVQTAEGTSVIDAIVTQLQALINYLLNALGKDQSTTTESCLKTARYFAFDFSEFVSRMVDIPNWLKTVDRLANESQCDGLSDFARIKQTLDNLVTDSQQVLAASSGSQVYKMSEVLCYPPTGYALFFPEMKFSVMGSNKYIRQLFEDVCKDSLMQQKLPGWLELLKKLELDISLP